MAEVSAREAMDRIEASAAYRRRKRLEHRRRRAGMVVAAQVRAEAERIWASLPVDPDWAEHRRVLEEAVAGGAETLPDGPQHG